MKDFEKIHSEVHNTINTVPEFPWHVTYFVRNSSVEDATKLNKIWKQFPDALNKVWAVYPGLYEFKYYMIHHHNLFWLKVSSVFYVLSIETPMEQFQTIVHFPFIEKLWVLRFYSDLPNTDIFSRIYSWKER